MGVKPGRGTESLWVAQRFTGRRRAQKFSIVGEKDRLFSSVVIDGAVVSVQAHLDGGKTHPDSGAHVMVFGVLIAMKAFANLAALMPVVGNHRELAASGVQD